jgi:hypothetical protein
MKEDCFVLFCRSEISQTMVQIRWFIRDVKQEQMKIQFMKIFGGVQH